MLKSREPSRNSSCLEFRNSLNSSKKIYPKSGFEQCCKSSEILKIKIRLFQANSMVFSQLNLVYLAFAGRPTGPINMVGDMVSHLLIKSSWIRV